MTRDSLPVYPESRRYACPLEKPEPRSLLAKPAFWYALSASLTIWALAAGVYLYCVGAL